MLLTCAQARALDHRAIYEFGIPSVVLMENAGRGIAELLRSLGASGPVVVCCGKGNNGGDGFVIARYLDNARVPVRVLLFAEPGSLAGDAAINHAILARGGVAIEVMTGATQEELAARLAGVDWVVDALFGTGMKGPVKPPFDGVIAAINASAARVLAVDIPSGLDADTGAPLGATVRAHHTATILASKVGFVAPGAAEWVGQVHVIDLGVPRRLLEDANAAP
jgi:NAD(P)H-hydrate epimerase